ncbi:MAG: L-rhamnose mutarotase [Ginsengibacter sp.]
MRYCFAVDLKDDEQLIKEYENYHRHIWPEIIDSIKNAGVNDLEIYRVSNHLFMIMETDQNFSLSKKNIMDQTNPKVQEWETIMWKYQQALPVAKPGEKWMLMNKIFELN